MRSLEPVAIRVKVPPKTEKIIFLSKRDSKVKKWAFQNAYMLIFLACMFFITWIVFIVSDLCT